MGCPMSQAASYAAVDLGASGGRVMVGRVGPAACELTEAHRFPNVPVRLPDGLHWDVLRLYREVLDGLGAAAAGAGSPQPTSPDRITSVAVDSWGVDYGLLDASGALLGNPYHYRDARTEGLAEVVAETGLPPSTVLTAVGSHDTASAVVAVPADGERFAYVSCGTWALVGVELDEPVLTEASRAA